MDDVQARILQHILASDDRALSVEELDYRSTDLDEHGIEDALGALADQGLVDCVMVETGEDLPDEWWRATDAAVETLRDAGMLDEISVLSEADDALDRTARIERIESAHPTPQN